MSLSQVRTFIKQQIALVDSSLKEHTDFNEENIPQTQIDSFYMIEYGTISSEHDDNSLADNFPVTVKLFKRGFKSPIVTLDSLMDAANEIRLCIVNTQAALTTNILDIEAISIFPEPINETNDNTIKISLEFNIKLYFATV